MTSFVRFVAGALTALAISGPVLADQPAPQLPSAVPTATTARAVAPGVAPRPSAVIVRIEGGFHPENRWLWYERDGTARFEGILSSHRGRFRSRIDYAKVEKLLADAELCTRHTTLVRPAGMDVFTYRVSVRCGDGWRLFTTYDAFEPAMSSRVHDAVRGLERLASTLAWTPTHEQINPPDVGGPFRHMEPINPR